MRALVRLSGCAGLSGSPLLAFAMRIKLHELANTLYAAS